MRTDEFKQIFKKEYCKLDRYFHNKLRNAKKYKDLQSTKEELIHETAVRVWTRLQTQASGNYEIDTLIWLIAPDIWKTYIKPNRISPFQYLPLEEMEPLCESYDIGNQLEAADYMAQMSMKTDPMQWNMITLHSKGHTFREIAEQLNKSESLVKKKVYGFRNKNKE
jgi:DNA-directed RNA polymerase specialized sigma24 family protein